MVHALERDTDMLEGISGANKVRAGSESMAKSIRALRYHDPRARLSSSRLWGRVQVQTCRRTVEQEA